MFGLCAVVLAEDGLVWNMRIMNDGPLGRKYAGDEASAAAPGKVAEVIALLDRQLQQQSDQGSRYLVGDALTAADIYWATMSMCITDTPPEIMPVTQQNQGMLKFFAANSRVPGNCRSAEQPNREQPHLDHVLRNACGFGRRGALVA